MRGKRPDRLVSGVVWVAALAALTAGQAAAQGGGAELRWSAPAGCPDQDTVQRALSVRLGAGSGAAVEANALVSTSARGYRLRLETVIEGQSGLRELEAQQCSELAYATEIIVALMIDPASVTAAEAEQLAATESAEPAEPEPAEAHSAETGVAGREPEPLPESDADAGVEQSEPDVPGPPLRVGFVARAGLLLDLGSLTALAPGPALSLGVRIERVELSFGGAWLPAQKVTSFRRAGRLALLELLSASAGTCYWLADSERTLAAAPCLSVEIGRVWGKGADIVDPRRGGATWAAAFAALRLDWPVADSFALFGELGAGLPLLRTTFRVEQVGAVHEASSVVGRLGLGLVLVP